MRIQLSRYKRLTPEEVTFLINDVNTRLAKGEDIEDIARDYGVNGRKLDNRLRQFGRVCEVKKRKQYVQRVSR